MNTYETERAILFSLKEKPALLETADITAADFTAGRMREIFSLIAEDWETKRPEWIDLASLADRLGGENPAGYLADLFSGEVRVDVETLRRRVAELKCRRLSKRIVQEALNLGECHLKTGAYPAKEYAELRRLILESETLDGDGARVPSFLTLSDIEAKPVSWLWLNFLPLGRAILISGDPDVGKSWFALNLAARLSRGLSWPDGARGEAPAKSFFIGIEDEAHDTIRPRIDSLGGDPAMVRIFNSGHPRHLNLSSPENLRRLENDIESFGNVRLVVIDPIIDFSGGVNPNAAEEVREFLTPLIALAGKLNFALVIVGHLNKAQTMSAIYRAGGSTGGWLGKVRAAFMIFKDIDDKKLRHFFKLKANLSPVDLPQLEFRLLSGTMDIRVSAEDVNPDEHLNPQPGRRPRERENAMAWLKVLFKDRDSIPSAEIETLAREKGFSFPTLKRAKHLVGLVSKKRKAASGEDAWFWVSPQGDQNV